MGENGAGKSTLLKCLFGICEKDQGKIFFRDGGQLHLVQEALGMAFPWCTRS